MCFDIILSNLCFNSLFHGQLCDICVYDMYKINSLFAEELVGKLPALLNVINN